MWPIGNPFPGLSLVETMAIATILLAGVLMLALARLGQVAPEVPSGQRFARPLHRPTRAGGRWRRA